MEKQNQIALPTANIAKTGPGQSVQNCENH